MSEVNGFIGRYRALNETNDSALENLMDVARGNGRSIEGLKGLQTSLGKMAEAFGSLVPSGVEYDWFGGSREDYVSKVEGLYDGFFSSDGAVRGFTVIDKILDSNQVSSGVADEINKRMVWRYNALNPKLEGDFDPSSVDLDKDIETPHDLIRYLHRVGTHLLFSPSGNDWQGTSGWNSVLQQGGITALAMDANDENGNAFDNNPFLKRLSEIAKGGKFKSKKSSWDAFYSVVADGHLTMQMPLGCHYANMQITPAGEGYTLRLKFTNTTRYRTSEERGDIAEKMLNGLEFAVDRKGPAFMAEKTTDGVDEALSSFEEAVRFSVSMQDLDVIDDKAALRVRIDDVAGAFKAGVINLCNFYCSYSPGEYDKALIDAGIKSAESLDKVVEEVVPENGADASDSSVPWDPAKDPYGPFAEEIKKGLVASDKVGPHKYSTDIDYNIPSGPVVEDDLGSKKDSGKPTGEKVPSSLEKLIASTSKPKKKGIFSKVQAALLGISPFFSFGKLSSPDNSDGQSGAEEMIPKNEINYKKVLGEIKSFKDIDYDKLDYSHNPYGLIEDHSSYNGIVPFSYKEDYISHVPFMFHHEELPAVELNDEIMKKADEYIKKITGKKKNDDEDDGKSEDA